MAEVSAQRRGQGGRRRSHNLALSRSQSRLGLLASVSKWVLADTCTMSAGSDFGKYSRVRDRWDRSATSAADFGTNPSPSLDSARPASGSWLTPPWPDQRQERLTSPRQLRTFLRCVARRADGGAGKLENEEALRVHRPCGQQKCESAVHRRPSHDDLRAIVTRADAGVGMLGPEDHHVVRAAWTSGPEWSVPFQREHVWHELRQCGESVRTEELATVGLGILIDLWGRSLFYWLTQGGKTTGDARRLSKASPWSTSSRIEPVQPWCAVRRVRHPATTCVGGGTAGGCRTSSVRGGLALPRRRQEPQRDGRLVLSRSMGAE